jgi:uncharacterized protein (DUF433 family)
MSAVIPEKVDLSKYIEMRDGRPNIRGRRLPVVFLASAQRLNHYSIADLMDSYTLSEEQVLAALLYYREHQEEIDAQDAEDLRVNDEMMQRYGKRKPDQA